MATHRTGQIALGGPTGGRIWPRWPPEVPSNCSHAVVLWPSPFCSVTLLPLRTNLSGCACAGLNGSSESWNKDTSHIDTVAPLQKQTQKELLKQSRFPNLITKPHKGGCHRSSHCIWGRYLSAKGQWEVYAWAGPLQHVMPYEWGL